MSPESQVHVILALHPSVEADTVSSHGQDKDHDDPDVDEDARGPLVPVLFGNGVLDHGDVMRHFGHVAFHHMV